MNKPVCSVVVTCYNYARFLPICLESVLKQTYQHFEIIVVNDGSTDNTDEVIDPYIKDPRIHYIKQQNAGQANAKNKGIQKAKGEFIAFLDADDFWGKTKLEKQISQFHEPQVGVVYSAVRYIDEQGNEVPFLHESTYLTPRSGKVTEFLFFDNFIPFSSSVVRRECFERVGVFDESVKMGIDWDLWLRLSVNYNFQFVDLPLLFYRQGHAGQMSQNLELRHVCSDRIMDKFLIQNPGILTDEIILKAKVYTYLNRGYYYRSKNVITSLEYYLKAIRSNPGHWGAWKGLTKTGLMALGIMRK
jgi:glycosyltransferase involved in cell wall biosynthesis